LLGVRSVLRTVKLDKFLETIFCWSVFPSSFFVQAAFHFPCLRVSGNSGSLCILNSKTNHPPLSLINFVYSGSLTIMNKQKYQWNNMSVVGNPNKLVDFDDVVDAITILITSIFPQESFEAVQEFTDGKSQTRVFLVKNTENQAIFHIFKCGDQKHR